MTTLAQRPAVNPDDEQRPADSAADAVQPRVPGLASDGGPRRRPEHAAHLSDEDVAALGAELDELRARIVASRGAADAAYIRRAIRLHRTMELAGRATLVLAGRHKAAWVLGTGLMATAKIIENMEIGHNVIHGQWDWMRDPDIHSSTWEWDFVAPAKGWKHTHNDLHHTWTNVIGKDSDVGYDLLRVSPDQPWKPHNLLNPVFNMVLAPFFEWGIALYDIETVKMRSGEKPREEWAADVRALGVKAGRQFAKDYVATPLVASLTGSGKAALAGTFAANSIRNLWAHTVIFCGHFPDGVEFFTEDMIEGETRGDWYIRQMIGSCNISGGRLMHFMTGNLSHQIEHHLFPDLPSNRYAEIAVVVRDLCERYRLPYVEGPLHRQIGQTWRTIFRLALP
ncbi:fatty acid desaturase family protein [Arsenicicoccus dermatophilus]|uniref:fatty acid desaturase family protein n=1 Tax=Arsenicicoccus dermatophilus TaxID=1076331 RepID=UPI001F4CFAC4|nr:acyl-CoA desaturase [Arsenicicoccus dermatophilus]MCH8612216.1 acyl-CoA desaturase [Arsenicicoccus dermatophilus]